MTTCSSIAYIDLCHSAMLRRAPAVRPLGRGAEERSLEVAGAESEDCGEGPQDRDTYVYIYIDTYVQ